MNKVSYEKLFRLQSMGDDVRVSKNSCKSIYDKVELCANILNMPVPDVFINQSPMVNAFTTGTSSPMIQIYSGLIDFLDDEELLAVIAHEMGHIKCGHVLYRMVTSFLQIGTSVLGPLKVLSDATIAVSLLEWERKSELSADRASLLVTQDIKPVINMLMKLAGGSKKIADQINYDDFIEQSRQYREMSSGMSGGAYKLYLNILRTHPFPVMRAVEIEEWSKTEEYKGLLGTGIQEKDNTKSFNNIPNKIEAMNEGVKSIPLTWSTPDVGNISAYNIYRSTSPYNDFQLIKTVSGRETNSYTDNGLKDGTNYYYQIKSVDLYNQESQPTEIVSAKTKEIPKSIKAISAKDGMVREAEISWCIGYDLPHSARIIIYRIEGELDFKKKNEFKKLNTVDRIQSKYLDEKLKDGVTYSYYIRIEQDGLLSEPSNTVNTNTKPLLAIPSNFSVTYSVNNLSFRWNSVNEAVSYTIYTSNLLFYKKKCTTDKTSCSVNMVLKPGRTFTYYIDAVDKYMRESAKSDGIAITIPKT